MNRKTVTRWINADCDGGLDALRPKKAKGTPGHIPTTLADEVTRWVIAGPAEQGLDRANWTHEELADHLLETHGIRTSRSAVQRFRSGIGIRPYRPTYRYDRGDPVKQAQAKEDLADLGQGRRPVNSSCRARTRPASRWSRRWPRRWGSRATGRRSAPGTARIGCPCSRSSTWRPPPFTATCWKAPRTPRRRPGLSTTRRMQAAFASHLRHAGRMYAREKHERVVILIDNAPWHRGKMIDEAMGDNPHREFKWLPSDSPQLNPVERFWKKLRRPATHNRLFDALADLKSSLRASLSYFQTVRHKVKSIIAGRPKRKTAK